MFVLASVYKQSENKKNGNKIRREERKEEGGGVIWSEKITSGSPWAPVRLQEMKNNLTGAIN